MSLNGKNNEEKIWNYLYKEFGNNNAVSGIMGNLNAESGLISTNLQNTYNNSLGYSDSSYTDGVDSGEYNNFIHDSAGYGLAQWTYWSRKEGLYNYAKSQGKSIGDLELQLDYLVKEIKENYGSLYNNLKNSKSVREASDLVLLQYERPADQSVSVREKRASYGNHYNTTYGGSSISYVDGYDIIDKETENSSGYNSSGKSGNSGGSSNSASGVNNSGSRFENSITGGKKIIDRLGKSGSPYFADVKMSIGGIDITPVPPQHLMSFSFTRLLGSNFGGSTFSVTLIDETAILVEYYLSRGFQDIKFIYGYANTDEYTDKYNDGKWFLGMMTEYSIDFNSAGLMVSIQGVSTGVSPVFNNTDKLKPTYTGTKISDIVKEIANDVGWSYTEDSITETQENANGYVLSTANQSPAEFVYSVLIPQAVSFDGQAGYSLYFNDLDGGCEVCFKPLVNPEYTGDEVIQFDYVYGSGQMGDCVFSFSPQVSGRITAMYGSEGMNATSVDENTNEIFEENANKQSYPTMYIVGDRTVNVDDTLIRVGASSLTRDQMRGYLYNLYSSTNSMVYTASLSMLGDPAIKPNTLISILVTNKDGVPHHTSGIYWVKSVTDSIDGGSYTTDLELQRRGSNVGDGTLNGNNVDTQRPNSEGVAGRYNDYSGSDGGSDGASSNLGGIGYGSSSANKVVGIAVDEIGYLGKVSNSMLNDKTGNSGGKYNKFANYLDNNTNFYNGRKNGYDWCDIFVDYCYVQAFGEDLARRMTGQPAGGCGAGCKFSANYYKDIGQWVTSNPKPGDQIFFKNTDGELCHTGLVVKVDGGKVYTVEGNTSTDSGHYIGGCVNDHVYNIDSSRIAGYGRPNWSLVS